MRSLYGISKSSVAARSFSRGAHAPSRAVVGALADHIPAQPSRHNTPWYALTVIAVRFIDWHHDLRARRKNDRTSKNARTPPIMLPGRSHQLREMPTGTLPFAVTKMNPTPKPKDSNGPSSIIGGGPIGLDGGKIAMIIRPITTATTNQTTKPVNETHTMFEMRLGRDLSASPQGVSGFFSDGIFALV